MIISNENLVLNLDIGAELLGYCSALASILQRIFFLHITAYEQ